MKVILQKMVEFQNFGLNALTISAAVTIFFSLVKGYGVFRQGKEVWEKRSGENVSPIFFSYNFLYFLIFLVFGLQEMSLAIIANGSLCLFYLPILVGLKKFRGFSKKELGMITLMSLVIPAIFLFEKERVVFAFSICGGIAIFIQGKEIIKERSFGAFSIRYLQTFFAASLFWGIYYACTNNYWLGFLNGCEVIILGIALALERHWRRQKAKRPFQ